MGLSWMAGAPGVNDVFGCGEPRDFPPGFAVTANGSMDLSMFVRWLGMCIFPIFLDMSPTFLYSSFGDIVSGPVGLKIDMGPGRFSKNAENYAMRMSAALRGLFIFPGLQNTTAAMQEMGELYALCQHLFQTNNERLLVEKINALARETKAAQQGGPAPATVVSLGNADLAFIINGRVGDPSEQRPFAHCFTQWRVLAAWEKIGAVPLTRSSLQLKGAPRRRRRRAPGGEARGPPSAARQERGGDGGRWPRCGRVCGASPCSVSRCAGADGRGAG